MINAEELITRLFRNCDDLNDSIKFSDIIEALKDQDIEYNKGSLVYKFKTPENTSISVTKSWTVRDARDGDFIYSEDTDVVFIFKKIYDGTIRYYCYYSFDENEFVVSDGTDWYGTIYGCSDLRPADLEEKTSLLDKINKAGYKWENNKLISINKSQKESIIKNAGEILEEMLDEWREDGQNIETYCDIDLFVQQFKQNLDKSV